MEIVCNLDPERLRQDMERIHRLRRVSNTPRRTVRIADDLWNAAKAKADERGEELSTVIRKALERYVRSKK